MRHGVDDSATVRLRPHWSMRSADFATWSLPILGVAFVLGTTAVPDVAVVVMCVGLVGALWWRTGSRIGIVLAPTGATAFRLFSRRDVRWDDVAALRTVGPEPVGRGPWGYVLVTLGRRARSSGFPHGVHLEVSARSVVRSYMAVHVPQVPIDPVEPWLDRFGKWHGPLHEFDPEESIRTIRRAAIGPFVVRIEATTSTFRAVTEDASGRRVSESADFDGMSDAIDAALVQIEAARSEL